MKVRLLVVGRSSSYLFLDTEHAPEEAQHCTLTFENVPWADVDNEHWVVWLYNTTNDKEIKIVKQDDFDYEANNDIWHPIPIPVIVVNEEEYNKYEDCEY